MMPTVLGVDDSGIVRAALAFRLEAAGHRFFSAVDGIDGLEKAAEFCPDVIITDMQMPRMDGITFIRKLRKKPEFATIPILVMSSERGGAVRDRAKAAGASEWISKSSIPDELASLVWRLANG
ncbi:response regulator [Salipiger sp. 1_MG-2023]|uniref:response regulator n=1 Tax=Salipiger sp. 1_MG-2023 TaxID=3062665 RepID=UPI0026E448B9|nr:response regulator [Salipiger sp. 1_MG-2023]MDO6587794.1 response regulator [Salipiger sp. 1_MG-2023]